MKPEDISKVLTEMPDVSGDPGVDLVLDYTLYDDNDFTVGFNYDEDEGRYWVHEVVWAISKETGQKMTGEEFIRLNAREGLDAVERLDEMLQEYVEQRKADVPDDIDAYKRAKEDAMLRRRGY
jgi:hypothetical protein